MKNNLLMDRYDKEVLPEVIAELKSSVPRLKSDSIESFQRKAFVLIQKALDGFIQLTGDAAPHLSPSTKAQIAITAYTAIKFNKVLPLDFPYILAVLKFKDTGQSLVVVITKDSIPGMHDCLRTGILPLIFAESEESFGQLDLSNASIDFHASIEKAFSRLLE